MTTSRPAVAVVILNWNRADDTLHAVRSVLNSKTNSMTITVVDNGSDAQCVSHLRRSLPERVRLVETGTNLGFSGGMNRGLFAVVPDGPDAVLFLNNDVVVDKDAITHLHSMLRDNEKIGAVAPRVLLRGPVLREIPTGYVLSLWRGEATPVSLGRSPLIGGFDYIYGCAIMVKTSVLMAVGGFDEAFFFYYDETDLCFRIRKAGYQLAVEPRAQVLHGGLTKSPTADEFRILHLTRSSIIFEAKHATRLEFASSLVWLIAVRLPRVLILTGPARGILGKWAAATRGIAAGLRWVGRRN